MRVRCALKYPDSFDEKSFKESKEFMLHKLYGEDALKEELVRGFWIPIFNAALESIERLE